MNIEIIEKIKEDKRTKGCKTCICSTCANYGATCGGFSGCPTCEGNGNTQKRAIPCASCPDYIMEVLDNE